MNGLESIIKRNSTTFANSSVFFPRDVWRDVVILYAFVRTADDFVDKIPQDVQGLCEFRTAYRAALNNPVSDSSILGQFADLVKRCRFDEEWVESFLDAMELDITQRTYETLEDTLKYTYGSAEVVGLMMARILKLPRQADYYARLLGRAFQYINFLRDIREDLELGRVYLPREEIVQCGLEGLDWGACMSRQKEFAEFMHRQIAHYRRWRQEAEPGFAFVPYRSHVAIKTAADMYDYTASVIERDPFIVWRRKVRPTKARVLLTGMWNLFYVHGRSHRTTAGNAPVE